MSSSDEDDAPKDKKIIKPTTTTKSNKRRVVYDDDDENDTPSKKKPKADQSKPKLKVVEDLNDVFGDKPIKRVEKPVSNKTEDFSDLFMDDLDVSAIPEADLSVNQTNGEEKEVGGDDRKMEYLDESVIESTPKQNRKRGGSDKSNSAKKAALNTSNVKTKPL